MKLDEHTIQCAVMEWAAAQSRLWPELDMLHAIPNGGKRHPAVALRMKREGVKPGVPDLFLPVQRQGFPGLYLEMKTLKGRVSKEQADWHVRLRYQGYRVEVCRGVDEAVSVLRDYMGM